MVNNKKGIAIVPGSFDPITNGHIDIVKRAAAEYNKVYLAVMINREKKYTFSLEERKQLAKVAVSKIPNVDVVASEGMLWELARDVNANAIVKGYRNSVDLEYEKKMAEFNESKFPQAKTVLLPSNPQLTEISSTIVRDRLLKGDSVDDLLPVEVNREINKILNKKSK